MRTRSSSSRPRVWLAAIAAFLFVSGSARAGRVWIVEGPSRGIYSDIQSAVNAARDGDILVVLPDTYPSFAIVDKSILLFAAGGGVDIAGTVTVRDLEIQKFVILSGISATGASVAGVSDPGLVLTNNAGNVRLQSCTFAGGQGSEYTWGDGGRGVVLTACSRTAFVRCLLQGGAGYYCCCCDAGNGGDGVVSTSSVTALYESACGGGDGGWGYTYGGNGGCGYRATSYGLFASGSAFQGGNGGPADDLPAYGGAGGDALFVDAGAGAHLLADSYSAGIGGTTVGHWGDGPPGHGVAGSGPVLYHSGPARLFDAETFFSDVGTRTVSIRGQPGERVYLAASSDFNFRFLPALTGVLLVRPPFWIPYPLVDTLPASGTLDLRLPVPDLHAPSIALLLNEQGFALDPSTPVVKTLGSPIYSLVLRRDASPDCNANGILDIFDVIEGASVDCNDNAIPDECDLASGTSADCNGNGTLDSCDIAAGTSFDTNANGIPDECEGLGPIWYVDASAPPGGNGTQGSPFQTIRQGIAAVNDGHTVMVEDGVYQGPDNRGLDMGTRNFTLTSRNGPGNCIIDCQGVSRAFSYLGYQTAASVLRGFTIRNGHDSLDGGGIRIIGSPTVENCVIENCSADHYGGGIVIWGGSPLVRNCTITGNACTWIHGAGGGIYIGTGHARVESCTISNNSAALGGGVCLRPYTNSRSTISACRIVENVATESGGGASVFLEIAGGNARIVNCLIAGNVSGGSGGGISVDAPNLAQPDLEILDSTVVDNHAATSGGGILLEEMGPAHLANTIVWGNTAASGLQLALLDTSRLSVSTCDVLGGMSAVYLDPGAVLNWGAGNIAADPLFVDPDGPDNNPATTADNDDRLRPFSPCIDAGDNTAVPAGITLDLDQLPRFVDDPTVIDTGIGSPPLVDMGAYERHP